MPICFIAFPSTGCLPTWQPRIFPVDAPVFGRVSPVLILVAFATTAFVTFCLQAIKNEK